MRQKLKHTRVLSRCSFMIRRPRSNWWTLHPSHVALPSRPHTHTPHTHTPTHTHTHTHTPTHTPTHTRGPVSQSELSVTLIASSCDCNGNHYVPVLLAMIIAVKTGFVRQDPGLPCFTKPILTR